MPHSACLLAAAGPGMRCTGPALQHGAAPTAAPARSPASPRAPTTTTRWIMSIYLLVLSIDHVVFRPRHLQPESVGFSVGMLFALPALRMLLLAPLGAYIDFWAFAWCMMLVAVAVIIFFSGSYSDHDHKWVPGARHRCCSAGSGRCIGAARARQHGRRLQPALGWWDDRSNASFAPAISATPADDHCAAGRAGMHSPAAGDPASPRVPCWLGAPGRSASPATTFPHGWPPSCFSSSTPPPPPASAGLGSSSGARIHRRSGSWTWSHARPSRRWSSRRW